MSIWHRNCYLNANMIVVFGERGFEHKVLKCRVSCK